MNELDNRGSNFYLALYWAKALAEQAGDADLQKRFKEAAKQLEENESKIIEELNSAQGRPVDIGGYYHPDPELLKKEMQPSETFNKIIRDLLDK